MRTHIANLAMPPCTNLATPAQPIAQMTDCIDCFVGPTRAQALSRFDPLVFRHLPSEDCADQVKAALNSLLSLMQRALHEMHDQGLHFVHRNNTVVEAGAAVDCLQKVVLGDIGEADDGVAGGVHPDIRKHLNQAQVEAAQGLLREVAGNSEDGLV